MAMDHNYFCWFGLGGYGGLGVLKPSFKWGYPKVTVIIHPVLPVIHIWGLAWDILEVSIDELSSSGRTHLFEILVHPIAGQLCQHFL